MDYLHRSAATRADIRHFLPVARSVIVTGTVYNTDGRPHRDAGSGPKDGSGSNDGSAAYADSVRVARYARGEDYHVVLAERLEALVAWMRTQHAEPFDAAHLRRQAPRAGARLRASRRAWVDRQEHLRHQPRAGVVDVPVGHCHQPRSRPGRARRSISAARARSASTRVPTGALVDPHVLDATKCISYLTIELAGAIPEAQRAAHRQSRLRLRHLPGRVSVEPRARCHPDPALPAPAPRRRQGNGAVAAHRPGVARIREGECDDPPAARGPAAQPRHRRSAIPATRRWWLRSIAPGDGVKNAAHSAHTPVVTGAVEWARRGRS